MEFNLRLQEHIELARNNKGLEAIAYAQKYLAPWKATEYKRIGQAMGLLAYKSDTECQPYKDMYNPDRWQELIEQFRTDNYTLCSLTSHPLLSITLQAGLSALKTPQCYQHEYRNENCPICDNETLGDLAMNLPLSHHVNSTIVCKISGKIMNEDNPPMLLPNGRVYSLSVSIDEAFYFYIPELTLYRLYKIWQIKIMERSLVPGQAINIQWTNLRKYSFLKQNKLFFLLLFL